MDSRIPAISWLFIMNLFQSGFHSNFGMYIMNQEEETLNACFLFWHNLFPQNEKYPPSIP